MYNLRNRIRKIEKVLTEEELEVWQKDPEFVDLALAYEAVGELVLRYRKEYIAILRDLYTERSAA